MPKVYKVLAPDGKTVLNLNGPEDATSDQIQTAAEEAWSKIKSKPGDKQINQNVMSEAASAPARMEDVSHGLANTFLQVSKNALLNRPVAVGQNIKDYFTKTSLNDKLADLGGLTRGALSGTVGAIVGLASDSPLVASTGMAFTDQALRKVTGQGTGSSIFPDNPTGAAFTGTAENEILGSVFPIIGRLAGLAGKLPIGNRALELLKLKPTLGQLTGHEGLENLFARVSKTKGVEESTSLVLNRVKDVVSGLTGKLNPSNEILSQLHQAEVDTAFRQFVNASNKEADNVIATSEIFQHQLPGKPISVQVPVVGSLTGQTTTIIQSNPLGGKVVKGPVWANNAIPRLVDIRKDIIPTSLSPDPDTPVANAIRGIFRDMNAEFNKDGSLKSYDPMDFQAAWKNKQIVDNLGYGNKVENLNAVDSRFHAISKALNKDIDESIYKWSADPADLQTLNNAFDSWKKAKGIVQVRHALFNPISESGLGVKTFLNSKDAPDPISNTIMYDYKKLDRFLRTGDFKYGNTIVSSTNAKKDMQGYALQKFFYDNWKPLDPLNLDIGEANGEKMATDFINYTGSEAGKKLFSKQQVAAYSDMFDAIKKVTKSPNVGLGKYLAFNFGMRTVSLGGAILAGNIAAHNVGSIAVAAGEGSLYGVARIMTNKNSAPIFNNMLHNRPLGMSFQAASRAMVQALSGQRITLNLIDGTKQEGIVGTDGKIRTIN